MVKARARLFNLKVSSLASTPIKVMPREPATSLRRLFRETRARVIAVTDEKEKLLGLIYRSSIVLLTSRRSYALAKDLMEDPPFTLSSNDSLDSAVKLMLKYDEWYGVVVDNENRLLSMIGLENIIRKGIEVYENELAKIKVEDYMTKRDIVVAYPDDTISSIISKMTEHRYTGLPVVNDNMKLVGIITQYDLISKGYTRIELESESGPGSGPKVKKVMTYSVTYFYPWTPLLEVAKVIVEKGFGRIPIVSSSTERKLVGIIDREDVVKALLDLELPGESHG